MRTWRPPAAAVISAIYALASVALFHNAWSDPRRLTLGSEGDPQQLMWFLGWMGHALTHRLDPLFTQQIDYPTGVNLMWNTSMPLASFILSPVVAIAGPALTYNILLSLGPALSALCAYIAFRRFSRDVPAALGGALYGFSSYTLAHAVAHANLVLAVLPPLVLLGCEVLVRHHTSPLVVGVLLGIAIGAEMLLTEEFVGTTALMGLLMAAALGLRYRQFVARLSERFMPAFAIAFVVAGLISVYPLVVQFRGPERLHGSINAPDVFSIDLLGFVLPTQVHLLAPQQLLAISSRFSGALSEWDGYIGLPLLVLLAVCAVRLRRDPAVYLGAMLVLAAALLSLGPRLHVAGTETAVRLPEGLLRHVPLLKEAVPARFTVFFFLGAGLLLAVWLDRAGGFAGRAAAPARALAILCLVPVLPSTAYATTANDVPAFFTSSVVRQLPPGTVILLAPFAGAGLPGAGGGAVMPMLWQEAAGMSFDMPEGYAHVPQRDLGTWASPPIGPTQRAMVTIQAGLTPLPLTPELRAQVIQEMDSWRLTAVVLGPDQHAHQLRDFFDQVLGRQPERVGGVDIWWLRKP